MLTRAVVIASMVAGLMAPMAASADHSSPTCIPTPIDTIGAHVEVADEEVHVPAITNAQLCANVSPPVGQSPPVRFTMHTGCGFPCFTLLMERGDWTVVGTYITVYLTYDADRAPTYVPVADGPIWVRGSNPNPACVALGNPIPECPPDTIAVPVPAPVL